MAGQAYAGSLIADAADPDVGDTLSFSRMTGPSWLNIATNGGLSGTPVSSDVGTNTFLIRVTDSGSLFDETTLKITVTPAPPIFSSLSREGSNLVLGWTGGIPPYQVQVKTNVQGAPWQSSGGPLNTNRLFLTPSNAAGFYRIQGQ